MPNIGNQGIRVNISTWWNHGGRSTTGDDLALPERPDLGEFPHAQDVMHALEVNYEECMASPVTDSWSFFKCDRIPDCKERWLTVYRDGTKIEGGA